MNLPAPYIHMAKVAEEAPSEPPEFTAEQINPGPNATKEQKTYADWLRRFYERTDEYTNEVTTRKHRVAQGLSVLGAGLVGALGGAALGGMFVGKRGVGLGAALGFTGSLMADAIGAYTGLKEPTRTRKEQLDYMNGDKGLLSEVFVPGYAGYQRARSAKHINSVVSKEIPKSVMKSKVRDLNDVAPA